METLWVGMSPYFPHCVKSNKNSVLLKAKKVVPCMWKAWGLITAPGKYFSEATCRTEQRACF